jgi:protein gp37
MFNKKRKPARIFVDSMGDLFYSGVRDEWIFTILEKIKGNPKHTFIVLTKRPERMVRVLTTWGGVIPNLWIGVSVENQAAADARLPILNSIPGYLKFVSVEPYLANMNIASYLGRDKVEWVIVGPENGLGARPSELKWYTALYDQCWQARIPIFIKSLPGVDKNTILPQQFPVIGGANVKS